MRILHLCSSINPATGGPANVLDRLSRIQAASGHEVIVVTADGPDEVPEVSKRLANAGVSLKLGGPYSGPFATGPNIKRLILEGVETKPDIAHIHGVWHYTPHWGSAMLRKARIRYVFRPCGMLDPWSLRHRSRLQKRLFLMLRGKRDLNGAAALHFTTETEKRLVDPMRLRPRPYVIANGIDWQEFELLPERGRFRRERSIAPDAPLVVFLSRLHPKKGIELLLPAFAKSAPADAVLALCGPDEKGYVETLRALAASLGIERRVLFPGMISGAKRLEALVDADLFCLPSYQENFGVAVIEAAGCGTPVLISDQVNICDDVVAAHAGEVVPCAVEPLADRLGSMLADRGLLRATGARAREWARSFDWKAIATKVESMYGDCLRA